MKRKVVLGIVLICLFALGFWSSIWLTGSAKNYEAGSKHNPLASKSYLEETVENELGQLEKEVEDLAERVDSLSRTLKK